MSINSIGFFGIFQGTPLSEETKRRLRALGIDPKFVKSESEAQILIKNAIKKQNVEEVKTFEQKTITESESELNKNQDIIFQMLNMSANINRVKFNL